MPSNHPAGPDSPWHRGDRTIGRRGEMELKNEVKSRGIWAREWRHHLQPREDRGPSTTRALDTPALLVRVLVRGGRVLTGLLAVLEPSLSVFLGLVVLAHFVVVGRLKVVVGGGRVVSGRLMVVLGRRVLGGRGHRSILFWDQGCGSSGSAVHRQPRTRVTTPG